jgi:CubicO group peptidase (beta-lactamase class C family)
MAGLTSALKPYVERGEVAGVVALVAQGETVEVVVVGVQDLATGAPIRRDTIFRIMSMTKPILAVAALGLVEERRIGLDDPVDRWLPELAGRRVLRTPDAALDDTVPAARPITLRDLLTLRLGLGAVMAPRGTWPIQRAMEAAGLAPSADPVDMPPDELMRRLRELPLAHQPGEAWMYHTGFDILAVLLARVAGEPLESLLRARIFTPLGMADTGFSVPADKLYRLGPAYARDGAGRLVVRDPAAGGFWSRPPQLPTELVSTADDYLAFARMLLGRGTWQGRRVLAPKSVALMTSDQLTAEQKAASPFFPGFWERHGWGMGVAVLTASDGIAPAGAYGWDGGLGTSWRNDPGADLVTILLIQRQMTAPDDTAIADDFRRAAHRALDV